MIFVAGSVDAKFAAILPEKVVVAVKLGPPMPGTPESVRITSIVKVFPEVLAGGVPTSFPNQSTVSHVLLLA